MFENNYFEALTYLNIKGVMFINDVDIFPNKELQKTLLDELLHAGYIKMNATSVWLDTNGFAYLEAHRLERLESLPKSIPATYATYVTKRKTQHGTNLVKGLKIVAKFINENIWLATIIGGLILYLIIVYISNHFGIKAQ